MRVKGILRYPGSKNRLSICQSVLSFFPNNIQEYREPFVGSGGIYFGQNPYDRRWINDIDENLISVYNELINNSESFIKECRKIPCLIESDNKEKCTKYLKYKFEEFLNSSMTPIKYFFLNRCCFGGRVRSKYCYFSHPEGWNITRNNG